MKQVYVLVLLITTALLIPVQSFAQSFDETTKYTERMFGIVSGTYNDKNGSLNLSGIYKLGNSKLSDVTISGQLKNWNYIDSSIPNCRFAFSDDMTIAFDKNRSHGKIILSGKLCEANWSGNYKTLRADYIIINGNTPFTEGFDGKGVIEIVINIKSSQAMHGKIHGLINLYT